MNKDKFGLKCHTRLVGFLALIASSSTGAAQGVLYDIDLPGAISAGTAGDLDGDGIADFAAGALSPEVVQAFSGADGTPLLIVDVGQPFSSPGAYHETWFVSAGDVNADGHGDLAIWRVQGTQFLSMVSGVDGAVIWSIGMPYPNALVGLSLEQVDDHDGDGVPDLVSSYVDSPAEAGPAVHLISGRTGHVLRVFDTTRGYGALIEPTGDLDGDGWNDLALGDGDWNRNGTPSFSGTGRVTVHSSRTGALIRTFQAPGLAEQFGHSVASMGDLDGDGVSELLIGAPQVYPYLGYGFARLYSGTGALLLEWNGADDPLNPLGGFGKKVLRISDLDGDGLADMLIGGRRTVAGTDHWEQSKLRAYSSADGALIYEATGGWTGVRVIPDINQDGFEDLVATQVGTPQGGAYELAVTLSMRPSPVVHASVCPTSPLSIGCWPSFNYTGTPSLSLGEDLSFWAGWFHAGSPAILLVSETMSPMPLDGGILCLGRPIQRLAIDQAGSQVQLCSSGGGGPGGSVEFTLSKSQLAGLGVPVGSKMFVQTWFRDQGVPPGNYGFTQGIEFTLWP